MKIRTLLLSVFLGTTFITSTAYSDAGNEAVQDASDPQLQAQFKSDMNKLVEDIKKDSKYKKIPLDSKADQEWFTSQAFLLWDHKMSKSDFVANGLNKFPSHEYEFNFIADRLSR